MSKKFRIIVDGNKDSAVEGLKVVIKASDPRISNSISYIINRKAKPSTSEPYVFKLVEVGWKSDDNTDKSGKFYVKCTCSDPNELPDNMSLRCELFVISPDFNSGGLPVITKDHVINEVGVLAGELSNTEFNPIGAQFTLSFSSGSPDFKVQEVSGNVVDASYWELVER